VQQPEFTERYYNPNVELPHEAEPGDVGDAIKELYDFYSELNVFLLESGFGRIKSITDYAQNCLDASLQDVDIYRDKSASQDTASDRSYWSQN